MAYFSTSFLKIAQKYDFFSFFNYFNNKYFYNYLIINKL